jgi:hypothetical protein
MQDQKERKMIYPMNREIKFGHPLVGDEYPGCIFAKIGINLNERYCPRSFPENPVEIMRKGRDSYA